MKKIFTVALFWLALAPAAFCQLHYSGSVNAELGVGINDMKCFSPMIGLHYTFNCFLALQARYTFAYGAVPGLHFEENNIELIAAFSPFYFFNTEKKLFLINVGVGAICKLQGFDDDFIPSMETNKMNIGIAADVETEFLVSRYWDFFVRATYRALFLDEHTRHELFYCAGVRMSFDVFIVATKKGITYRW